MDKDIQTCKRCILNSTVPSVTFDEDGICNYCKTHDDFEKEFQLNEIGEKQLNQLLEKVKKAGRKKNMIVLLVLVEVLIVHILYIWLKNLDYDL